MKRTNRKLALKVYYRCHGQSFTNCCTCCRSNDNNHGRVSKITCDVENHTWNEPTLFNITYVDEFVSWRNSSTYVDDHVSLLRRAYSTLETSYFTIRIGIPCNLSIFRYVSQMDCIVLVFILNAAICRKHDNVAKATSFMHTKERR